MDFLGDKKTRRDSWDMGFKGDYVDFQHNKTLQGLILEPRVEFAAKILKYSSNAKCKNEGSLKIKRKLSMKEINSVTVSPNDDSFFVLHAKDHDNILDCKMLPEFLNKLAVVFRLERDTELKLTVTDGADFQVKGGDTRCIHFSRTGSTRLAISPSKKTFTVAAGIGRDESHEEEADLPEMGVEKRASINLFVDKVARKLSHSYSVHTPDPKAFTAVAKAICGPSGGGLP